jgi:hypothetical protein
MLSYPFVHLGCVTVDNLLDECPNEHDVTLVKTTHVDAQHSQDVQMDNLAWYCNFLSKS